MKAGEAGGVEAGGLAEGVAGANKGFVSFASLLFDTLADVVALVVAYCVCGFCCGLL